VHLGSGNFMIVVSLDKEFGMYTPKPQTELKQFIKTASQPEIIQYWRDVIAPQYGYTELRDGKTNKLVAKAK